MDKLLSKKATFTQVIETIGMATEMDPLRIELY